MDDSGNILVKRISKSNVYVKNTTEENAISNDILKVKTDDGSIYESLCYPPPPKKKHKSEFVKNTQTLSNNLMTTLSEAMTIKNIF
jgi:uncharacterized protein (DUF1919 family)